MDLKALSERFRAASGGVLQSWLGTWCANAVKNRDAGLIREDMNLAGLQGVFRGTCVICGPGPSLDETIPALKAGSFNVVTMNSALNPLLANGVQPVATVICHCDDGPAAQVREVAGRLNEDALLVAPATIHPETIRAWPGQKFFYVSHDPSPEHQVIELAMENLFPGMGRLTAGGSAGTLALDVAWLLGFRRILVTGLEFGGGPDGRYYGRRYDMETGEVRSEGMAQAAPPGGLRAQNDFYRLAFEQRVKWMQGQGEPFEVINLSEYSMLEIPRGSLEARAA